MFGSKPAEHGDVLEFCDGEGFVSGTMIKESEKEGLGSGYLLQVGSERQWVHQTDVVAILKKRQERSDVPLLEERLKL